MSFGTSDILCERRLHSGTEVDSDTSCRKCKRWGKPDCNVESDSQAVLKGESNASEGCLIKSPSIPVQMLGYKYVLGAENPRSTELNPSVVSTRVNLLK